MKIYAFDRSQSPVIWRKATKEDIRFCKFIGWLNTENDVIAVAHVMMDHRQICDSFMRFYNTHNSVDIGEPNAAGIIEQYKITGWHSLFLDLSTPGDLMSPIREAIAQIVEN